MAAYVPIGAPSFGAAVSMCAVEVVMGHGIDDRADGHQRELAKTLDTAGWGLFFIWVGIAVLADLGWGAALLGVGVITLAGQALRHHFGVPAEGFWSLVGLVLALAGVWLLVGLQLGEPRLGGLMPAVSIVVGVVLVVSALRRRRDKDTRGNACGS